MSIPQQSEVVPTGDERAVHFRVACEDAAGGSRSRGAYFKFALWNPLHFSLLASGAMVFGLESRSLLAALLAFGFMEVLLLGVVSRMRVFRRYADASFARVERSRAAEARAMLLLRVDDEHRRDLQRLESLVDRMRASTPDRPGLEAVVDECLRLLATYVDLAIAHNAGRQVLAQTDRPALEDVGRALEVTRSPSNAQACTLADQRMAIARRRAERWDRSRDSVDTITQQLAMIGELVQLTHEQVLAPIDPRDTACEMDRLLVQLDASKAAVDELAGFAFVENDVEACMLDMGRAGTFGLWRP